MPISPVQMTERRVSPMSRGILLPMRSERAPKSGIEIATRIMEEERATPYKMSAPPLSTVTHRGK